MFLRFLLTDIFLACRRHPSSLNYLQRFIDGAIGEIDDAASCHLLATPIPLIITH